MTGQIYKELGSTRLLPYPTLRRDDFETLFQVGIARDAGRAGDFSTGTGAGTVTGGPKPASYLSARLET